MDNLVGALAIFTMGAVVLVGLFFFLRHNRDPKNRAATKEVLTDGPSASGGGNKPDHAN